MALVDIDTWITEYDACERLRIDIQSNIALRNAELLHSAGYVKISERVRFELKQYQTNLIQLKQSLQQSSDRGSITRQEAERRDRQIEHLQSQYIHLQEQFKKSVDANAERKELFNNSRPSYWNTGKGLLDDDDDDDDEPIADFRGQAFGSQMPSVEDSRKQRVRIIEEQNEGLDTLSKAISRQKHLALRIGDEVGEQTEIIDGIATSMDNTGLRINSETRNVDIVIQKDSTGWYWLIIIALFFINVIVALF